MCYEREVELFSISGVVYNYGNILMSIYRLDTHDLKNRNSGPIGPLKEFCGFQPNSSTSEGSHVTSMTKFASNRASTFQLRPSSAFSAYLRILLNFLNEAKFHIFSLFQHTELPQCFIQ